jgi:hypothetical protein
MIGTPDLPISGSMINKLDSKENPLACNVQQEATDAELHELEYDGLENLAGFICYKLDNPNVERSNNLNYTWTDHLSEGGLHKPSDEFLLQIEQIEQIFKSYNGDFFLFCIVCILILIYVRDSVAYC